MKNAAAGRSASQN